MYVEELRDLLQCGVKWELNEHPTTNTDTVSKIQPQTTTSKTSTTVVPPIAPVQTISQSTAVAMAARPNDIDALCRMIAEFGHPLRDSATNVVLPSIATNPNGLVIVTDMPGADDDATGKILSGQSGELMDKMLAAIGMSRDNVSIIPMLFWRTPGGRGPSRNETDLARPFVDKAIEMLAPRVILTMGTLPATELGNIQLARDHGTVIDLANGIKLVAMYHPNYLILKPTAKRDAWTTLQNIQKLLKTV